MQDLHDHFNLTRHRTLAPQPPPERHRIDPQKPRHSRIMRPPGDPPLMPQTILKQKTQPLRGHLQPLPVPGGVDLAAQALTLYLLRRRRKRRIYRRWPLSHNRCMVKKRPEPERIAIPMPEDLVRRIDEFRWQNRLPSRAEAIRQLVEEGLKPKPQKP